MSKRRRQGASEHGLANTSYWNAQVQSGLDRPTTGALLTSGIHDDIHQRLACLLIDLGENLSGDLNQVGVQVALVPLAEDICNLSRGEASGLAQKVVGLADDLHIRVLDAVVDHLHEVASAIGGNVCTARNAINVSGDGLQQRAEGLVGLLRATRHNGWAGQSTFLTTGNASADVVQATGANSLLTTDGVRVKRVTAINDDVAGLHHVGKLIDDRISSGTCLNHNQSATRALQRSDELFNGLGRDE